MSDGEDEKTRKGKTRSHRGRVTLKWEALPLLLPGEKPSGDEGRDTEEMLALPDEQVRDGTHDTGPLFAEEDLADAWERQRPRRQGTPPPFRPPIIDGVIGHENEGGALDLVDRRSRPKMPALDLFAEMADRYALGDYTAALRIAELILGRDPQNDAALDMAESCRAKLEQLYGSRLGSFDRVLSVAVSPHEVRWLGLDHRAAFVLSRIDGQQTLAQLIETSGIGRLEVLKTVVELLERGAIRLSA